MKKTICFLTTIIALTLLGCSSDDDENVFKDAKSDIVIDGAPVKVIGVTCSDEYPKTPGFYHLFMLMENEIKVTIEIDDAVHDGEVVDLTKEDSNLDSGKANRSWFIDTSRESTYRTLFYGSGGSSFRPFLPGSTLYIKKLSDTSFIIRFNLNFEVDGEAHAWIGYYEGRVKFL